MLWEGKGICHPSIPFICCDDHANRRLNPGKARDRGPDGLSWKDTLASIAAVGRCTWTTGSVFLLLLLLFFSSDSATVTHSHSGGLWNLALASPLLYFNLSTPDISFLFQPSWEAGCGDEYTNDAITVSSLESRNTVPLRMFCSTKCKSLHIRDWPYGCG